jgi:phosphoribosyl-AMP cyclohydrolase
MIKLKPKEAKKIAELLNYRHNGRVVAIIQDAKTSEILMTAFMDAKAVKQTLTTGLAHYKRRKRRTLWLKGETSRHYQHVKEIFVDCDSDALLLKVEQDIGACHLGYKSCFHRKLSRGKLKTVKPKIFKPEKVYRKKSR